MGFYKLNEGGVSNDEGVLIQIKHPDYLEYRDGIFSVYVSIGYDPKERKIYVYARDLTHWINPDSQASISEATRRDICNNLTEGLGLLTGNYVIC